MELAKGSSLSDRAPRDHIVQFYESDDYLSSAVAGFLAGGLTAGQPGMVIATEEHRQAIHAHLQHGGFDVGRLRATGQLQFLDARETLSTFMNGRQLDAARVRAHLGTTFERQFSGRDTTVWAYGEMVDLLWQDQNVDAALELEELWNELGRVYPVSVLCSYALRRFDKRAHAGRFEDVCRVHTQVIPAESYTQAAGKDGRAREVSRLQQRARALETEIVERRKLERLLDAEKVARAESDTSNRLKDAFLAVLSHELRAPLDTILGWPAGGRASYTITGARVLVVDDEENGRELLTQMMERAGAVVQAAASAGEAVSLLASGSYDLLLADLGLPGQEGYALIAAIRSLPEPRIRRLPAIAVSAQAGLNNRAIVAGYDDCVEPTDAARLTAAASRLLSGLPDKLR
jgi:CheY-like chemotaxis protein